MTPIKFLLVNLLMKLSIALQCSVLSVEDKITSHESNAQFHELSTCLKLVVTYFCINISLKFKKKYSTKDALQSSA